MQKPDVQLVRECLAGDKEAFGFLVDKYKGAVYALAYYRVHNPTDAEDVAQEAFLRAYQRLPSLKNPHCFASWLYTLTVRCATNWLAKHIQPNTQSLDLTERESLYAVAEQTHWQSRLQQEVRDAIAVLPESQRLPVVMYYLGGLSTQETAEFLGVSHGSIRVRLHRARQQLREELSDMLERTFGAIRLDAQFTLQLMERLQPHRFQRPIPMLQPLATAGTMLFSMAFILLSLFGLPGWMHLTPARFGTPTPMEVELLTADVSPISTPARFGNTPPSQEMSHSLIQFSNGEGSQWGAPGAAQVPYERYWQSLQAQETTTLSGQVLREDKPVAEATVYLFPWLGSYHRLRLVTHTDAQGFFQFEKLPVTQYERNRTVGYPLQAYDLVAYSPEYAISIKHIQELHKPTSLRLEMEEPHTLSGVVRDENGQPIPNAMMQVAFCQQILHPYIPGIRPTIQETVPFSGILSARTGIDGHFRVTNLPASAQVRLLGTAAGYRVIAELCSVGEEYGFTMSPAATVRGTVRFQDGGPAAGVEIRAGDQYARTNDEGVYEFTGAQLGTLECIPLPPGTPGAWSDDWIPSELPIAGVQAGQTIKKDILLVRAAVISGRITDAETGEPIPGAEVECKDALRARDYPEYAAIADVDGRYTAKVTPGDVQIAVARPYGYGKYAKHGDIAPDTEHRRILHLAAGEHATDVDFQLKKGLDISGIVLRPDGQPAVGAMVFDGRGTPPVHEQAEPYAMTDAQGRFIIRSLFIHSDPGKERRNLVTPLIVSHPSEPWYASAMAHAGEETVIQLEPYRPTNVSGRVMNDQQQPIPNAMLTLYRIRDAHTAGWSVPRELVPINVHSDSEGRFELQNVMTDSRYRVAVKTPDMLETVSPEFVATPEPLHLPDIIVRRYSTTFLGGVVVDSSGNPVQDMWITAASGAMQVDSDGQPLKDTWSGRRISESVQSDAQGKFRLSSLVGEKVELNFVTGGRLHLRLRNVPTGRTDLRIELPDADDTEGRDGNTILREWAQ